MRMLPPRVNIQEFCEEYYEDILPIIMDKVRRDRRKDVHTRLDFEEGPKERTREDSHHSIARARTTKPERLKSAFDRLNETYSPSTTKSRPRGTDSRGRPQVRSRPHRLDTSNQDCPKDKERFRSIGESYDDSFSHSYRDKNRSRHMKMRKDNESLLSSMSKSDSSDGRYQKSRSKRHKSTNEDDLTRPWMCEEVWFDELPPESIDSYKDLKAAFLAYFMQQKKYVKDPVEIHNIKQKDGETIEDFMERFKVETERMKGAPESAAASKKKGHTSWKVQDQSKRQTSDKRSDFRGHSREGRGSNRFTPLTRMPKEILTAEAGHSTDERMQLKKQIEELVRAASSGTEGPLIIEAEMGRHMIHRIGIIGRPGKREIQAVTSTAHGMLKFPVEEGIVTICSTILIPTECTSVITSSTVSKEERTRPDNFKVALHPDFPDQEVAIEGTVPRSLAEHQLNIREGYLPVQQKKRGQAPARAKAIQAEVQKLVEAGIMREVYYHNWLSNPVMNAGAAYQRLMDKAFDSQIGRNIEVYVDDLVVKSYTEDEMLRDIDETFRTTTAQIEYHARSTQYHVQAKNVDGSSRVDGFGVGLILTNPEGIEFTYVLRFQFAASNNEAESEALIAGLRIAAQMGVQNVHVSVDSMLVANQVLGTYVAKEENMVKYLVKVKSLVRGFTNFWISQVPRSKNKKADALSKIASTSFAHLSKQVLVEVLKDKSIKEKEVTTVVEEDGPTWMIPIVEYLKEGTLLSDRKMARKLRIKARQYELMEGILYRRSFLTPWLRCDRPIQAEYMIREIHEGSCSMHVGPRSVVPKAIRLRYYCPTMHWDAHDMIRKCNDWNWHSWILPEGPGKVKFLIVAMDYFTKWIEAKAVATITSGQVKKFVWDNIVCRFGLSGIKARLGEGNKNWVEELPHVIWVHRTMIKSSHGDTPFSLTYRTEAVIPAEIKMSTYRTAAVDVVSNDEELQLNLDLLEERRERAMICEAKAKLKMMKYYNAWVHGVAFRPGDFVNCSNDASHAVAGQKLGPKWEGPYDMCLITHIFNPLKKIKKRTKIGSKPDKNGKHVEAGKS
nr:reverse transcriptase domain-containing protein [Tanacetum cinerariifolium]